MYRWVHPYQIAEQYNNLAKGYEEFRLNLSKLNTAQLLLTRKYLVNSRAYLEHFLHFPNFEVTAAVQNALNELDKTVSAIDLILDENKENSEYEEQEKRYNAWVESGHPPPFVPDGIPEKWM